jgi:hypothetical protein
MANEATPFKIVIRGRQDPLKRGSFVPLKLRRTNKQLEPIADQVAANSKIMNRLRTLSAKATRSGTRPLLRVRTDSRFKPKHC